MNEEEMDLGLGQEMTLNIAAQERLQLAVAYKTLSIRQQALIAYGDATAIKEIESKLAQCEAGIKKIDSLYPQALARQQEIIVRQK